MAYVKCINNTERSLDVEVVSGTIEYTGPSYFEISSASGKTPKRLQVWKSSDLVTYLNWITWNSARADVCEVQLRSGEGAPIVNTVYHSRGVEEYSANIYYIGDDKIGIIFPYRTAAKEGMWTYYAEFE